MKKAALAVPVLLVVACGGADEKGAPVNDVQNWEAASVHEEASSTHLWIVEHAIDILGRHPENARAKAARALLQDPACTPRWQQGLYDADYLHQYNNGRTDLPANASVATIAAAGTTWKSHFYDPDSNQNYMGETSPTARTEALAHYANAQRLIASNKGNACYELGLSLHYLTDIAQPMHAANFTATNLPRELHTDVEDWAMTIQDDFALGDWSGAPAGSVEAFVVATARSSKAQWQPLWNAIADAYEVSSDTILCGSLRTPSWDVSVTQQIDHAHCWNTAAPVKAAVGQALRKAQDATARYLALVGGLS